MSLPTLRQRKKDDTRRMISDVARKLFAQHGFDAVTVNDIAAAAGIAKMTVFNYFARKEELFFDRNEEARQVLDRVIAGRRKGESVLDLLQRAAHQLARERHVFATFTRGVSTFWRAVEASDALQAYVREIRGDAEMTIAELIARETGGRQIDPTARLLAGIFVTGWQTAYNEAIRRQRAGASAEKAKRVFLTVVDQAFVASAAVAAGTPYAQRARNDL
ncbi:MAG: TetR/AcrR family transcriptional regulator [Polyangiaceae bacterium]